MSHADQKSTARHHGSVLGTAPEDPYRWIFSRRPTHGVNRAVPSRNDKPTKKAPTTVVYHGHSLDPEGPGALSHLKSNVAQYSRSSTTCTAQQTRCRGANTSRKTWNGKVLSRILPIPLENGLARARLLVGIHGTAVECEGWWMAQDSGEHDLQAVDARVTETRIV